MAPCQQGLWILVVDGSAFEKRLVRPFVVDGDLSWSGGVIEGNRHIIALLVQILH